MYTYRLTENVIIYSHQPLVGGSFLNLLFGVDVYED